MEAFRNNLQQLQGPLMWFCVTLACWSRSSKSTYVGPG